MRKTLAAAALVLAFSCHAGAGIMHIPPAPEPVPTPASATQETAEGVTLNGDMSTPSVSEIVLELLAVLPSIL